MLHAALSFNMLHLLYHQLMLHFDFYPLNNVRVISRRERIWASAAGGILMLFPLIAVRTGNNLLIMVGLACLAFILIKEVATWWLPYCTKPSVAWRNRYQQVFQETIKILPPIGDNPVPNLEHCVLHLLTLLSLGTTLVYYLTKQ